MDLIQKLTSKRELVYVSIAASVLGLHLGCYKETSTSSQGKDIESIQIIKEEPVNSEPIIKLKEKIYSQSIKVQETIKREPLAIYSREEMIPSIEEWRERDYKDGFWFKDRQEIAEKKLRLKAQYWQKIELMESDPKQALEKLTEKESKWLEDLLAKKIEDIPKLQNLEFQFPNINWESKIAEIYLGKNKSRDLDDKVRIFNYNYFYKTADDEPSFFRILSDISSRTILKKPLYAGCKIEDKRIAFKIGEFEIYNESNFFTAFDTETYNLTWNIPITEKGITISHEETKRRVKKFVVENKTHLIISLRWDFGGKVRNEVNDKYKKLIDIDHVVSSFIDNDRYINEIIAIRKPGTPLPQLPNPFEMWDIDLDKILDKMYQEHFQKIFPDAEVKIHPSKKVKPK